MLFLTVYGPELESLFLYIHKFAHKHEKVSQEHLYSVYLPHMSSISKGKTKNIEDALNYLKATRLIEGDSAYSSLLENEDISLPFAALLLRQFRQLEQVSLSLPLIDHLYITLLEQLYVTSNRLWINDVHAAANQLDLAQQIGGISQEKIGAWKRVTEFLGLGYRVGNGFYCLYQPELIEVLARRWNKTEDTLQEFLEGYLQSWLPCLSARGDLALPAAHALDQLAQNGRIRLSPKQDSPSKPYFGTRYLRGIEIL
jgi:hypothetical protein